MRTQSKYSGWIAVSRAMFNHPILDDGIYCRRLAWIDLIAMASYEPATMGELRASLRFLSRRWRWSFAAVQRFLNRLEKEGMIERKRQNHQPIHQQGHLIICNYKQYQLARYTNRYAPRYKDKKKQITKENTRARACEPEAPRAPRFNATTHRKFVETLHGDEVLTAWAKVGEGLQQRLAKFNGGH